jgi:2-keto-4-pentenoate hydratase
MGVECGRGNTRLWTRQHATPTPALPLPGGGSKAAAARLTMNPTSTQEAAELLWRHRCDGTVLHELPPALRPHSPAQGHAIQAQLPRVAGEQVVGWKIAATSAAGQAHINVGGPLAGRILASFVLDNGSTLSLAGNRMRVAEPEFAFCMARDLPPRAAPYSVAEVLDAVATLHPAFEIPDSRFAEFTRAGQAQLIADDACCGTFAFGRAAPALWRDIALRTHRVLGCVANAEGTQLERAGEGSAALGDPAVALAWLVNELSSLGTPLEAGQFVSTGTCMVPMAIAPGGSAHADFGVLGSVQLAFSA